MQQSTPFFRCPSLEHRSCLHWNLWVSVDQMVSVLMKYHHSLAGGPNCCLGVTCPDTYAVSHVALATREARAMAASAEVKKSNKYKELARAHHVAPLAIETSGVFGPGTQEFVTDLGRRIIRVSGDSLARSTNDSTNFGCCAERKHCLCA